MDVSHIHHVLSCFTKSLVSVPIKTNAFEEVYSDNNQQTNMTLSSQKFEMLDDILFECRNFTKSTREDNIKSKSTMLSNNNDSRKISLVNNNNNGQQVKNSYVDELLYTVSCINDPLLTLKPFDKSIVTKMKQELLSYLDNTQVKTLDMAKYKYTKKGLREIFNVDYKAFDTLDWNIVKALLVVSARYLKKSFVIQVQGELKEHIPLPPSMIKEQEPSSSKSVTINYENGRFVML